jgi:hypothetical protein
MTDVLGSTAAHAVRDAEKARAPTDEGREAVVDGTGPHWML